MNKRLQAEFWETQIWLMWILAVLLQETEHLILMWLVIAWSIITSIGVIVKLTKAIIEEKVAPTTDV